MASIGPSIGHQLNRDYPSRTFFFFPSIMGRKRIYHTPEAKLAADRAKSKRYYNKYVPLQTVAKVRSQ